MGTEVWGLSLRIWKVERPTEKQGSFVWRESLKTWCGQSGPGEHIKREGNMTGKIEEERSSEEVARANTTHNTHTVMLRVT